MATIAIDETREKRIADYILVDTENDEERSAAWYHFLDSKVTFPFQATFEGDDDVEVISLSSEEECLDEMKMEVRHLDSFGEEPFTALVIDLEPLDADDDSISAIEDWQYWWERGNRLNEPETEAIADFPDDVDEMEIGEADLDDED